MNSITETINRLPRMPISRQPWSRAQRLMRERNISPRDIAAATELPTSTVIQAISLAPLGQPDRQAVLLMRQACEIMLAQSGADFDLHTLWNDYDSVLSNEQA